MGLDELEAVNADADQRSGRSKANTDKVTKAFDEWRPRARPCSVCQRTAGLEPKPRRAIAEGLNILACSDGKAIAAWGAHAAHGRLLGWLKYSVDRIRIAKYRTPGDPHETRYTTNP